jgi:hypothetical protein
MRRLLPLVWLVACGPVPAAVEMGDGGSPSEDVMGPDWFAVDVVNVTYGDHAGFGQEQFPAVILGPPNGGGRNRGSLDVLSLGFHGSITLRLGRDAVDGPGPDFIVFENAFVQVSGNQTWAEPARVEASLDGQSWAEFPCAASAYPYTGCAGVNPTLATGPDGGVDPRDPSVAGGDAFDLADVGLATARFVRITDVSTTDTGGTSSGFDLDGVAVVRHASP